MPLVTEPLVLAPDLQARPWAGSRLGPGIGEAWDLSAHPAGPTRVARGPLAGRTLSEVVATAPDDLGGPLRLLAKRLDTAAPLSVQVHPVDAEAKTEAWVVLDADPGAGVWLGVADPVDAATVEAAALDGSLPELLRFVELTVGQAVFVPSGTIHAIGPGLSLFELQQSSDVTYRLFDWGRSGRALHLTAGLACAALEPGPPLPAPPPPGPGGARLVACEHFVIDRCRTDGPTSVDPGSAWAALLVTAGAARVGPVEVAEGETVLVARSVGTVDVVPGPGFAGLRYGPPADPVGLYG